MVKIWNKKRIKNERETFGCERIAKFIMGECDDVRNSSGRFRVKYMNWIGDDVERNYKDVDIRK